ncbi:K(+)-transporting ATPase subunit F [[Kitasatospora] papulosa]|nr:K(+)-transporting ATPase subunit F [Streptomyces sp. NRRL S-15]
MSVENAVGLVVAVCLVVHLVLCLLFADRLSVVELNRELR